MALLRSFPLLAGGEPISSFFSHTVSEFGAQHHQNSDVLAFSSLVDRLLIPLFALLHHWLL